MLYIWYKIADIAYLPTVASSPNLRRVTKLAHTFGQSDLIQQEYEAIYRASLAVASYPAVQRPVGRRKREDDEDEDEDRYGHASFPSPSTFLIRVSRIDDRKRALFDNPPVTYSFGDPNAMETS